MLNYRRFQNDGAEETINFPFHSLLNLVQIFLFLKPIKRSILVL
jgi:hypothetical protein